MKLFTDKCVRQLHPHCCPEAAKFYTATRTHSRADMLMESCTPGETKRRHEDTRVRIFTCHSSNVSVPHCREDKIIRRNVYNLNERALPHYTCTNHPVFCPKLFLPKRAALLSCHIWYLSLALSRPSTSYFRNEPAALKNTMTLSYEKAHMAFSRYTYAYIHTYQYVPTTGFPRQSALVYTCAFAAPCVYVHLRFDPHEHLLRL